MIQTTIGTDIIKAQQFLEAGELVAIPTETVYGLAGNALNPEAVVKIFEAKNRPSFNPLIVHLGSWQQAQEYVQDVPDKAHKLAAKFCPGPLSFLLTRKPVIPDLVTAGSDLVAIRIPDHPFTLQLLKQLNFPVAAPSANPFGYISPTCAQHVWDGLHGKISYILDGGETQVGLESTIIGFDADNNVILYRKGGVSREQLEAELNEPVRDAVPVLQKQPATAGQLKSHYAPHTALIVGDISGLLNEHAGKNLAVISFKHEYHQPGVKHSIVLSPAGNLSEAARNLFQALRSADKLNVDLILAEYVPDQGIGQAINDRLQRAREENKIPE